MTASGQDHLPELMARYQAGDFDAFEEIYCLTVKDIEVYCARHGEPASRADLVQEVYLQVHRARRTYRTELPFRPWLFAIARHVALMAARRRRRKTGREVLVAEVPQHGIEAAEPDVFARRRLEQGIRMLSPEQREVIRLTHVEGLTSTEIGRLTGITPGAVKVRLHRAHARLRNWFGVARQEEARKDEKE